MRKFDVYSPFTSYNSILFNLVYAMSGNVLWVEKMFNPKSNEPIVEGTVFQ